MKHKFEFDELSLPEQLYIPYEQIFLNYEYDDQRRVH